MSPADQQEDMSEATDASEVPPGTTTDDGTRRDGEGDMSDLLQELRVLLQGVQVLTGFLIVLPFSEGFSRVSESEKKVYLVLFLCVLLSLVLFSATAAQHRLLSPLRNRVTFKRGSARLVVAGMVPLSAALVLATHFVLDEVASPRIRDIATWFVGITIAILWWISPLVRRRRTGV
jgi:hypothetical protein